MGSPKFQSHPTIVSEEIIVDRSVNTVVVPKQTVGAVKATCGEGITVTATVAVSEQGPGLVINVTVKVPALVKI